MKERRTAVRSRRVSLVVALVAIMRGTLTLAQDVSPAPAAPSAAAAVPSPAPASPPSPPSQQALLEQRLRKLEEMNQRILQQYEQMEKKHNERYEKLSQEFKSLQERVKGDKNPPPLDPRGSQVNYSGDAARALVPGIVSQMTGEEVPDDEKLEEPEGTVGRGFAIGDGTAESTGAVRRGPRTAVGPNVPRAPQGTISRRMPSEEDRGVKASVGRGLRFTSDDDEFQVVFHNLTQAEFRGFPNNPSTAPLKSQFFIPRQRWYLVGRVTKEVEFYTDINRGYGSIDLLDAFLDLSFLGPKAVLRVGRTKTPVSYEYFQIAEGDLIAPERSIYTGNLSGNRQNGFMEHGRILKETAEYAIGIFNGPRRSFGDFNNDKDIFAFFNIRPFQLTDWKPLQVLNVGGELDYGNQHNPPQPNVFTTANDQSSTGSDATVATLSPEFFMFNANVIENGPRQHGATWLAWYYKSFNALVQYDSGVSDYSVGNSGYRTQVPFSGYFGQIYYFLTGEQIKRRVDVAPNRDFKIHNGRITGPGALEVHARYSYFNIGRDVFTAGLADANLWTSNVYAIDTGLNWYPNRYTKVYFDWQHSVFGQPVFDGPGLLHKTADLIWLRFQLFF